MTLKEAIDNLEAYYPNNKVAMIEYEDGSGNKFNYRLFNESKNRFIDFSKENNFVWNYIKLQKVLKSF